MNLARALRPLLGDILVVDGTRIFAVNVAGAGLAFLSHILFARWLGVGSYGIYVFALSWLNVLLIAQQAGLNVSLVRFAAELNASGDGAALRRLMKFSNAVVTTLGAITLVGGAIALAILARPANDELIAALYVMLALSLLLALLQQRMALLQGLERVFQSVLLFEIARPMLVLAVAGAAVIFWRLDAALLMAVNLVVTGVVLMVAIRFATRCLPAASTAGSPAPAGWRHWLRTSLPYIAVTGLTILLTQMDVLMIGALLGPEQAGLYAPAAKVALLAIFPVVAIRQRFGPMAARLFAAGDMTALQSRMTLATALSIAACVGVLAVILPGRDLILGLFGPAYTAGAPVVLVLAAGYLAYSVAGAAEMFFLVGPFERMNALVVLLTLGVNILLNLLLIPRFGIVGAAYGTVAAVAFRAILSAAVVRHRTGLLPFAWRPGLRTTSS